MKKQLFLITLLLACLHAIAQDVPTPAPAQQERISLKGGTVHVGNGVVIENGIVVFEKGKIEGVFKNAELPSNFNLGKIIDVTGKQVYPGLIALNTTLGITEIEAVRATNDFREVGDASPNAKAIVAYNTDSRVTPTVRSNGVLYAQIMPHGGMITGTSAVVQLDAWNWEDAAVNTTDGLLINWPSMYNRKGWWAEPGGYEENKNYISETNKIKEYLLEAKSYQYTENNKKNLRFEAMKAVLENKANLYIEVNYVKEILDAISMCEELNIQPVLVGARDAYLIADILAEKKIAVVLFETASLPSYQDEDIQQPYKTPAILQKAGVQYCVTNSGFWQVRNLAFQAGMAVGYGLSKEEALSSITLNAAKILKLDAKIGSLEKGKSASIIVSSGDVLDMQSSEIVLAYIDGRAIDLDNKQTALAKKFSQKYGIELKK